MRSRPRFYALLLIFLLAPQAGCEEIARITGRNWHEKFNWDAEDYFEDPQVIALCEAIEAEDLKEIDRLVAAGADVNAQGKGKMTPLLWAYPDNKPERFKRLLEHGADPNVTVESDFNTRMSGIVPGDSVTQLASSTAFPKYFEHVFAHGGDPNLWHQRTYSTPLFLLIRGPVRDKIPKAKQLLELGADINANKGYEPTAGGTPVMTAVICFGQYELALALLEAGADYKVYRVNRTSKLIHSVLGEEDRLPFMNEEQKADYYKLVKWMEDHGESIEEARADLKRWRSWSSKDRKKLRKQEIAERKAREKQEQETVQP